MTWFDTGGNEPPFEPTATKTRAQVYVHHQQNGRYAVVYIAESGSQFVHARYDSLWEARNMARALARIHDCPWETR